MKPSRIIEVLDLAYEARLLNQVANIRFIGSAGLGKSAIIRQWANKQKEKYPDFKYLDIRIALCESPDLLGMVEVITDVNGNKRTSHCTPDMWPTEGHGVIILEEIARGNTSVMNCLMQILQERQVGPHYKIPDGWMVVAADNQEDPSYDVNSLDTALRNRFIEVDVEYDHNTFVSYIAQNNWCEHIQSFVKSGTWIYKEANSLGKDGKYISPRTWEQLNSIHMSGALKDAQLHHMMCTSILGKDIGNEFWRFVHDDAPVTAKDLIADSKKALKKLKKQSKPEAYQGDKISVTIESIVKHYGAKEPTAEQVSEALMIQVAEIISADQSVVLLKEIGFKYYTANIAKFFEDVAKSNPQLIEILKANIKLNKATPTADKKK